MPEINGPAMEPMENNRSKKFDSSLLVKTVVDQYCSIIK
jgi:hypothetical protein